MKTIEVLNIVVIKAVDWAIYHEQVDSNTEFDVVRGLIVGFLINETDDYMVLTQQKFSSGQVRQTISIPKACILDYATYTYNHDS